MLSISNHHTSIESIIAIAVLKHKRSVPPIVRSPGPADVRKTFVAGNPLGFLVPVFDRALAGGWPAKGAAGDHELAQGPIGVVAVPEGAVLGAAGHVLGQQARLVDPRNEISVGNDIEEHRIDGIQLQGGIEGFPRKYVVWTCCVVLWCVVVFIRSFVAHRMEANGVKQSKAK